MTDVEAVKCCIELVRQIPGPSFHQNMQGNNAHHDALRMAVRALTAFLEQLQSPGEDPWKAVPEQKSC